jgi:very-short-patch-repair endonuclease
MDLRDRVLQTFRSVKGSWMQCRINDPANAALVQEVLQHFQSSSTAESLYLCSTGVIAPHCRQCAGLIRFKSLKYGYGGPFCSISCSSKYNAASAIQTKNTRGTNADFGSALHRSAMLERYGHEFAGQIPSVQEKSKSTMLARHGVQHGVQLTSDAVRAQSTRSPEVNDRRISTNLSSYGVPHAVSAEVVRAKSSATSTARYGVPYPMQDPHVLSGVVRSKHASWIERRITALEATLELLSPATAVLNKNSLLSWRCRTCSSRFISNLDDGKIPKCAACFPAAKIGNKLRTLLLEHIGDVSPHKIDDRSVLAPYELDIWYPEHKLGVEINGLYWHSESVSGKRHAEFNKMILGDKAGIRILNIWEDEILQHSEKVGALVRSAAGVFKESISASELTPKFITADEVQRFVQEVCLTTFSGAVNVGLFKEAELYAALSINKTGVDTYELAGYCTALDVDITGVLSVLLRFSAADISGRITARVDRRLYSVQPYLSAGFARVSDTDPDFWYTDYRNRFNKNECTSSADVLWDCGFTVLRADL